MNVAPIQRRMCCGSPTLSCRHPKSSCNWAACYGAVVSLDDITSRLRMDPSLTARLIRIANSAAFASSEPVASVEDAVTLIGFDEVHRLVDSRCWSALGTETCRYTASRRNASWKIRYLAPF